MALRARIVGTLLLSFAFAFVWPRATATAQDTTSDTTTTTTASDTGATDTTGTAAETTETGWVDPAPPGAGTGTGLTARPFYVGAGVGLDAGLTGGGGGVLFAAEEDVGYRFYGFNLGGALDGAIFAGLSFGQAAGSNFIGLQFDVRGGVDLEVWDGGSLQLLVTPSITLGGGAFIITIPDAFGNPNSTTVGAFDLGFSAQGELVMLDGLLGIWLRPLSFELFINNNVGALYELLAGVNIRL